MVSPTSSTSSTHTHVERDVHTDLVAQDGSQNGVQLETQKVDDQDVLATLPEPKTVDGAALNRPPTRVYIKDHGPCTEIPPAQSPTLNLDSPVGQTPSPHAISPTQTTQATQTTHIAQSTPPARPFPPVIRQTTASSTRPYSAFPNHTKWLIVVLSGIAGIFSPISSNIFVPAIPALSTAFNRSQQDISLAVTIYLVFQAVTPSFFGSMSDSFGRRPVYLGTLTVYMGANVGLALCPTDAYWLLLVLRALQSTGGSAVISIGAGCISDIAEPRERGKFYAIFQLGATVGPAFGPLLGGVLAQTLGWRSIFWFLTISTAVVLVPVIFFLPETLRSLVGDGTIPPPMLNMSPPMVIQKRKMDREHIARGEAGEVIERPTHKKYEPLSAFMILFTPEIVLVFIFVSLLYLEFYCILTVFSTALKDSYQFDELKIGVAYLPNGFGTIISSQLSGHQLDWYYRREEKRVGGDYRKKGDEFRVDLTRIRCITPFMTIFVTASIGLGWCLQAKAPLAATLVVGFFVGLGTGTMNAATLYGQDLMPDKGGAVSAALNLVRCSFGAVGTAVVQLLYDAIGAGWTMVLLSGMCVIAVPIPLCVIKYAPGWRATRVEKARRRGEGRGGGSTRGEGQGGAGGTLGRDKVQQQA